MDAYPLGFEDDDLLRSAFIRNLTLQQLDRAGALSAGDAPQSAVIPRRLIRYWHDPGAVPEDVRDCLDSWDRLGADGFEFRMFSDASASAYIAERYGARERKAFARCRHPAMRSDFLRMCFVLAEGGLYGTPLRFRIFLCACTPTCGLPAPKSSPGGLVKIPCPRPRPSETYRCGCELPELHERIEMSRVIIGNKGRRRAPPEIDQVGYY